MMSYEAYMSQVIQPMRDELTRVGFTELKTPEEVEKALSELKGTALVVVNSVCGCAAGLARPAVAHSLNHAKKPDHLYTVFAGQDKEATAKAREYFEGYPPSSPSFALMKDGKIMTMIERHQIENNDLGTISKLLTDAYDKYCD
ncbi:BrxA/BrxB family bacilliredoxin [Brevibacillus composti]|uniref:BrxA/BrxB family bacilliredoxin n=1 Tax=Brevibacillus composti TaxID=2796470 RepID=A0A7T5ELP0_9BACL|nr:BrxA/BrxB family bacilliredoxin [Brevibacillus composti]QQE74847.1 BrxA/BrxB family bacilliredoxin [Brevibacillus composti]QUO41931.1 BrxA/BrxB family bacilliredoxin [Brevibacillus composti]